MADQYTLGLLRSAFQSSVGESRFAELARTSLRALVDPADDDETQVYLEETAPEQAELDLHLTGSGVLGHATNAHSFSQFVSGISEAVKETAKALAGKGSYTEGLLIEGAAHGSVRLVLRAPQPVTEETPIDGVTNVTSVDSRALLQVGSLLSHAGEEGDDSPLLAELRQLPAAARRGLKRASKSADSAGWQIDGVVRQRGRGADRIRLSRDGTRRLISALDDETAETSYERLFAKIDGARQSINSVWFAPDTGGTPIRAGVPDGELLKKVARLGADPDGLVEAVFQVLTSTTSGASPRTQKSRVLVAVEAAPTTLPLFKVPGLLG